MAALVPSDYRFTIDDAEAGEESPRLTIVCEPTFDTEGRGDDCKAVAIRLVPGVTMDEARKLASMLQRSVGGFCHLELRDDGQARASAPGQ